MYYYVIIMYYYIYILLYYIYLYFWLQSFIKVEFGNELYLISALIKYQLTRNDKIFVSLVLKKINSCG